MTKIYVHGILAKKFGSFFQFSISNAISALKAIDANKEGFLQEIKKLNKFGLDYFILVDDEIINNQGDFNVRKKISNAFLFFERSVFRTSGILVVGFFFSNSFPINEIDSFK